MLLTRARWPTAALICELRYSCLDCSHSAELLPAQALMDRHLDAGATSIQYSGIGNFAYNGLFSVPLRLGPAFWGPSCR